MKKESYEKIFDGLEKAGIKPEVLDHAGKLITFATAALYFLVLIRLCICRSFGEFISLIFVPLVSFVLCSVIRACLHAKRPYEVYGFEPLVAKDTKEKSFPSRHVFSVFVIATSIMWVDMGIGTVLLVFGVVLAVLRVLIGVHFPKDVAAGAAFGIICGMAAGIYTLF